ncbi:hypothetical protein BKA67DRAFT_596432 [Truncatella angustata]|uniref:FAD-binding domain-containing protein n=1 Tax=Truncatella angustata TaxID=152316 RepID=A0A9P8UB50_9PEZI|nr:uncharacterized protein BKA67DRAFT_596432 [Truncatella angustata]KAH6638662.1 hypothetical protein BKA67DRAFT_596432 [Truncatella angustata]
MPSGGFKVIVVGGGPVGLTAAHALTRANIDFVVLERRSCIVIDAGASLVLVPMGMRVLGQLGLLDSLKKVSSPLPQIGRCDHNGNDLGVMTIFEGIKKNHGEYPRVLGRHELTKILFESLPRESQERMRPNKQVQNISTSKDGVTVSCTDGTSFEGSIVIGADGCHSPVREQMRLMALNTEPTSGAALNAENPYLTTYRCFWVRFPTKTGLQPGQVNETHGNGLGIQVFAGDDTAVMGLYERLEKPTKLRARYTEIDEEAFVGRWGHLPIAKGVTVRDAYNARIHTGLVDLEEGVVEHWSWGRIVLVGDAKHKFTPSTGSGFNNGVADVAVLMNQLHRIVGSNDNRPQSQSTSPSMNDITTAFKIYQDTRYDSVKAGCEQSSGATAMATWQSTGLWFFDKYIFPSAFLQRFLANRGSKTIAKTPVLDFVSGAEPMNGVVPWVQPIKSSF